MNNEEKNLTPENEGVEENKTSAPTEQEKGKKGLSGGLLAAIIGGVAVVILAVILLVVLLPGKDSGNTGDGGEGNGDVQPETKVTYTVTVVDQDGNPVAGVKVQMCDDSGLCLIPTATNDEGIATYKYQEGNFHVLLNTLVDGYTVDDMSTYYYFEGREVTIEITKN